MLKANGHSVPEPMRSRVEDQFPVLTGHAVTAVAQRGDEVALTMTQRDGSRGELTADHIISATGYRPDLRRLSFLGQDLAARLTTVDDSIAVDKSYQSSVPGLYFVGPLVAPSFGPVMRFVFGSKHAAYSVTRQLVRSKG